MEFIKRATNKASRIKNDWVFYSGIGAKKALSKTAHTILLYHGVDASGNTRWNSRHTAVDVLYRHIKFLQKYAAIISLRDFFEGNFVEGKPNFVFTFDDGYLNNFSYALDVFEANKAPATFFITGLNCVEHAFIWADYLDIVTQKRQRDIVLFGEVFTKKNGRYISRDSGVDLYTRIKNERADYPYKQELYRSTSDEDYLADENTKMYWELMSDEEIKRCSKSPYIEIGSHGFLHNNLGRIPLADAEDELKKSKNYLEQLIQKEVCSLAYPDGSYTRELLEKAEQIGFKYQTAAEGLLFDADNADLRMRDRLGVYSWDSCANQLMINF
jgi:peptidoglycan/xylan/chitin deacetylase (PgdA/CDA1 family)